MAQVQGEEIYLSHSGQEVDDNIDEVVAARGDSESLSARLAAIVSDFEADQQRQDAVISSKADKTEIHGFYSTIDSSITITAYVDSLNAGHYVSFYTNASRPADAPVDANTVIEIYKYSASTIIIRALPISSTYSNLFFQLSKSGGTWRNWIKFEGAPVTTVQSSAASLMQAGRIDAELTAAEPEKEEDA